MNRQKIDDISKLIKRLELVEDYLEELRHWAIGEYTFSYARQSGMVLEPKMVELLWQQYSDEKAELVKKLDETIPSNLLSYEDIKVFNSYIEDNDMPTAFGNSDWNKVYSKIVGNNQTEKIKEWKQQFI